MTIRQKLPLEPVAVIPCAQGETCWCRMLVYESYLRDRRRKNKIIIDSGCAHKGHVEQLADLINHAYANTTPRRPSGRPPRP